ncbi:MAG: prepilin peptidase [Rhodoblastus sp.]|nr:MAG: prepilin peptidase [Rhodoblastus sp.]
MIREAALLLFFPALMAYSAASDLITMRISNGISIALVAGFLAFAAATGVPLATVGWHFACAAVVLLITFTLFAIGQIGGGDAKLAAATALWFGFPHVMEYGLISSVLGGFLTMGLLALRRWPAPQFVRDTPWMFRLHNPKVGIPYGIALAAAALIIYPETAIWTAGVMG